MLKSLFRPLTSKNGQVLLHNQLKALSTKSFQFSDLEISLTSDPKPKPDPNNLIFGKEYADHMLVIEYGDGQWGKPIIKPLENLSLHPGAKALHYALQLFEGMKAYRGVDDKIRLFRPDKNMERMKASAHRCCFPDFDGEELIKCMKKLISIDQEWVPYSTSSTLYIRPTMIGHEGTLGVSPSNDCMLFVITGPVGPYFPTGMRPVRLLADPSFVRAWPGGAGRSKMGSNYAPTIAVQKEAEARNCQQVLWLFGEEHYITEVGTMNIFVLMKDVHGEMELVTPPLDQDVILPGVTRNSLLELARSWKEFKVSERTLTMGELMAALNEGRLLEVFGAGTACVVCPVEYILYGNQELHIPTMDEGAPYTLRFYKELTDIQFGRHASDWVQTID